MMPLRLLQDRRNIVALEIFEGEALVARYSRRRSLSSVLVCGQVLWKDAWPMSKDHRPLDDVFQLSYVPRLVVLEEQPHRLLGDPFDRGIDDDIRSREALYRWI